MVFVILHTDIFCVVFVYKYPMIKDHMIQFNAYSVMNVNLCEQLE